MSVTKERVFKLGFELSAEDQDRLRAAFFSPGPAIEQTRQLSVYLDTPDAVLHQQNLTWCFSRKDKFRDDGRLKAGEWRIDGESDSKSFVKKHRLRQRIGGVFTMRLDREQIIHQAGATEIEIALERRLLRSGDQSATTFEAQFVLRAGETEDLVRFVSELLPQAVPTPGGSSYVQRGYRLAGIAELAPPSGNVSKLDKDMRVADAFRLILRGELERASEQPAAVDAASVHDNIQALRRVQSAFRFFAGEDSNVFQGDLRAFAEWETALARAHELDVVLTAHLKPAAARGHWECVDSLIARIEESRARAYVILAQIWPAARVANLFQTAGDRLEIHVSTVAANVHGDSSLAGFLSRILAKALEDIQTHGTLWEGTGKGKAKTEDLRLLAESVRGLVDVVSFFEPLATGKAARRLAALLEALVDLKKCLEKDHRLAYAQTLVADVAAHIARMKQTKTQIAQTYAAGALSGFLEARKEDVPGKALKKALSALSEVKPFWTKLD